METFLLIVSLIVMLAGLAGTIVPMMPGIPVIYAGYFIYGFASDWRHYGLWVMVALGVVTALSQTLDYYAGALGARKFGASAAGIWGAVIGGILGAIFFNVVGLVAGPFVGALAGELMAGRNLRDSFRSGWGAFLGFVAGSFFRLIVGLFMILGFVWLIVF